MTILNLETGLDARMLLELYGISQVEYGCYLARSINRQRPFSRQSISLTLEQHRDTLLPQKHREALQALLEEKTLERWQKYPISISTPKSQEQP